MGLLTKTAYIRYDNALVKFRDVRKQWKIPGRIGPPVTIAGHEGAEVPKGTLASIFRQSGMEMKYYVVYEQASDGGFGAYSPDLPGVGIVAATRDEARASIRKAIEMHLAALIDDGLPVPQPSGEFVEIAA